MTKLLKEHWIFLVILAFGIFLRLYKPLELFMYSHDQDLQGWIIRDVLENKHLRLIGQETTSQGVFIGPLFYYALIPFYLFFRMDPAGGIVLVTLISGFSIFSYYWVFKKMFGRNVGLTASFFYSLSYYVIFVDREIVPTMVVMLWTVWYFYGLYLLIKGNQKAFIFLGLLLGLIWNFNISLSILSPLIIFAFFLSKKKLNLKYTLLGFTVLVLTLLPYLAFEVRHDFRQTNAIYQSLFSPKDYVTGTSVGLAKTDRLFQLIHKNTTSLFWDSVLNVPPALTFYLLVIVFIYLIKKGVILGKLGALMVVWQIIYIVFFSINSLNLSEYYLNGMNVVWIAIVALSLSLLLEPRYKKFFFGRQTLSFAYLFLIFYIFLNIYGFFRKPIDRSGYLEKKALVNYIYEDAKSHDYPCVAVSYITSPGREFGYRYFYYLLGMHVNQPISESPVYTIVFPHTKVSRIDKSFGALGLVLPDYGRYNKESVSESCSGGNSNLTDPMFGYTE